MQTRNRQDRATRKRGMRFAIATISMLATAGVAWAAAGNLDAGFGDLGIVVASASGNTPGAAVNSTDGSIVVCGSQAVSGTDATGRARSAWLLRRFDVNGAIDTGFGSGGVATLFGDSDDLARRVAIDSNGGAIVVGRTTTFQTAKRTVVATKYTTLVRLKSDGSLDTGFGSSGVVRVTPPGAQSGSGGANDALVISDGKIVVAGAANFKIDNKGTIRAYPFLARYSASGTLDTTFGTSGFAVDKRASVSVAPIALALQSTGHFVLAVKGSGVNWMITRHLASGGVDTNFAAIVQSGDYIGGIATDASDRIVATGRNTYANGRFDVLVCRYSATGSPDGDFGSSGRALVNVTYNQNCWADPIVHPADGKVVVGVNLVSSTGSGVAATLRLLDGGSLDASYGASGVGDQLDPFSRNASASAVAFAPDGRIHLVGLTQPSLGTWNWMLARFDAN